MEDQVGTCPVDETIGVYAEPRLLRQAIANKTRTYLFKQLPVDAKFDLFLELVEGHPDGFSGRAIREGEPVDAVGNLTVGYRELALVQTDDGRVGFGLFEEKHRSVAGLKHRHPRHVKDRVADSSAYGCDGHCLRRIAFEAFLNVDRVAGKDQFAVAAAVSI